MNPFPSPCKHHSEFKRTATWEVRYTYTTNEALSGKSLTLTTTIRFDDAEAALAAVATIAGDKSYKLLSIQKVVEYEF